MQVPPLGGLAAERQTRWARPAGSNALRAKREERARRETFAHDASGALHRRWPASRARGSLAAGLLIAEICHGWPRPPVAPACRWWRPSTPGPNLDRGATARRPVLACLASQYAGWSLSASKEENRRQEVSSSLGLGPRPVRWPARRPCSPSWVYRDRADAGVLVMEVDRAPPKVVIDKLLHDCGLQPHSLTVILTPTTSLAGTTQIVARVARGLRCTRAHQLGFALGKHRRGPRGSAPLAGAEPRRRR